jgi:hypothetical protein
MPDISRMRTHSPSSLDTPLCTLMREPGGHLDLVRMPAHGGAIARDLLTKQSEKDRNIERAAAKS